MEDAFAWDYDSNCGFMMTSELGSSASGLMAGSCNANKFPFICETSAFA